MEWGGGDILYHSAIDTTCRHKRNNLGSGRALEGGRGREIRLLAIFSRWTEAGRAFCLGGRAGWTGSSHAVAQEFSS